MSRIAARRRVTRVNLGRAPSERADHLTVEEPLELRVRGRSLAVTMRTPGHDVELGIGFLLSEGVVTSGDQVRTARYCAGATADEGNTYNVLDLDLLPEVPSPEPGVERAFTTTSSCGLCGKSSIEDVRTRSPYDVAGDPVRITAETIVGLPDRLRELQTVFNRTGGIHGAALYDPATDQLLVVREDIGRHNAVDKVIGWAAQRGLLPGTGMVLLVSSRASFELTQKAFMAGIPVLAAVSAASSLAADLAEEAGLTLIGFIRGDSMVVYTGAERIVHDGGSGEDRGPQRREMAQA